MSIYVFHFLTHLLFIHTSLKVCKAIRLMSLYANVCPEIKTTAEHEWEGMACVFMCVGLCIYRHGLVSNAKSKFIFLALDQPGG